MAQRLLPQISSCISDGPEPAPKKLIARMKQSNDSLYYLVPYLDEIIDSDCDTASDIQHENPEGSSEPSPEEKAYENNILHKFPHLNGRVARNLARVNWIRHARIRDMSESYEAGQNTGIDASHFEKKAARADCDSVLSTDSDSNSDDFSTIATTTAESIGQTAVPLPPVQLQRDVEFLCNICFTVQRGIYNKHQWKFVISTLSVDHC